jgi:hypothetical protein
MIQRCHNPNYPQWKDYGGRGIEVCNEWRNSFEAFFRYIGPRPSPNHTIDRIENNRGYEPGNVRWATRKEQNRNSRNNHLIRFNNQIHCMTEWAEILGIKRETIKDRIRAGWPIDKAFNNQKRSRIQGSVRDLEKRLTQ